MYEVWIDYWEDFEAEREGYPPVFSELIGVFNTEMEALYFVSKKYDWCFWYEVDPEDGELLLLIRETPQYYCELSVEAA